MSYYYPYPYPYPIYTYPITPIIPVYQPTTITAISTPLIQQTPGWNPIHGHDTGSSPLGVGNRVVGLATGLAMPIGGVALVHTGAHTAGLCGNCGNANANGNGNGNASTSTNAPANSSTPDPPSGAQPGSGSGSGSGPQPSTSKANPKSILKSTLSATSNPSSSSPSSPTKSKTEAGPPLSILTHANTNVNAKSGSSS